MKKILFAGAAASVALFAASAQAATQPGWYGALDVGAHTTDTIKSGSSLDAPDGSPYSFNWSTQTDWVGFARVGYQFTDHVRVELEGGYRPTTLNGVLASDQSRTGEPAGLCTVGVTRTASAPSCGLSFRNGTV